MWRCRNRTRELEQKLASLMKGFEFQMRENVRAVEDRAAQQKLSKEAERRITRLRREFQESFQPDGCRSSHRCGCGGCECATACGSSCGCRRPGAA